MKVVEVLKGQQVHLTQMCSRFDERRNKMALDTRNKTEELSRMKGELTALSAQYSSDLSKLTQSCELCLTNNQIGGIVILQSWSNILCPRFRYARLR